MQNILTLYKKIYNCKNRVKIKNIFKREEHFIGELPNINFIIENPSGEFIITNNTSFNDSILYVIKDGRMKKFSIYEIVYFYNNTLLFFKDYRLILIKNSYTQYFNYNRLKKLVINNQFIKSCNLDSLDLEYIDLKNNYLSYIVCTKFVSFCDVRNNKLKKININAKILLMDKKGRIGKHRLLNITNSKNLYIKYKIYNISYRFYIIFKDLPNIEFILNSILFNLQITNLIDTVDDIFFKLRKMCLIFGCFYIVCITKENIIIKSHNVRVLFDYFLRSELIYKDYTYIFDNIGKWYILPIYDNSNESCIINTNSNESCIINSNSNSNNEMFDYSVIITNQSNRNKTNTKYFKKCNVLPPDVIYKKYNKIYKQVESNKTGIFMFVKLKDKEKRKQEKLLKKLKSLKICTIIEDNGIDGIIFMSQDIKKLLEYALYMKKVFMSYRVGLSIGISCGNYFFKMENRKPKFMGDVLIKASRMSFLGKGVFCCSCAAIFDNDNMYFHFIGERKVRGFSKCLKIFIVYKN